MILLGVVLALSTLHMEYGRASTYTPWVAQFAHPGGERVRISSGKGPFCNVLGYGYTPADCIIAHRTLPCGTRVLLVYPQRATLTLAVVGGRGPYGARGRRQVGEYSCSNTGTRGWCVKRTGAAPGEWRGIVDLTPPARQALKHRGLGHVWLLTTRTEVGRAAQEFQRRLRRARRYRQ